MSSPKALAARQRVLDLIQQAQTLLDQAHQASAPLEGWAKERPKGPYYLIRDHVEATRELWHKVNNAPAPTGYWEG